MKRFGLIGQTLNYSFSKEYFTHKFKSEGRTDHVYENYELDTIRAFPFLMERHPDLAGLNVTIPYKKDILQYLHTTDDAVKAIGACNCIRINSGRLEGYNTDWAGFRDSLAPLLEVHHVKALVLGTGGAAAAILYALSNLEISYVSVSRQPLSGLYSYSDIDADLLAQHTLVINTTPVGTWPQIHEKPEFPYSAIGPQHLLYDLVYNPGQTAFLREGAERGAKTKNGYEMLVMQAEASWEIWNR
jgi:shikimate dehydrogenase